MNARDVDVPRTRIRVNIRKLIFVPEGPNVKTADQSA